MASATVIVMVILSVVFTFARLVFGVKIEGSLIGFIAGCLRGVWIDDVELWVVDRVVWERLRRGRGGCRSLATSADGDVERRVDSQLPVSEVAAGCDERWFRHGGRWMGLDAMTWRGLPIDRSDDANAGVGCVSPDYLERLRR